MFKNTRVKARLNGLVGQALFIVLISFLVATPLSAQNYTVAETKAVEKSKQLHTKGKYDKAISTLNKVLFAHVHDAELWQYRVLYEKSRYDAEWDKDYAAIIKQINKSGTATVDPAKMKSFQYRDEMLYACYGATLYAPRQDLAGLLLHEAYVEPSVDTAVSDEAKAFLNKGYQAQADKSNPEAIRQFEKAYKEDTTYYTAASNIAYVYYLEENYDKAIDWCKKSIRMQPEMFEPRYYLLDIYMKQKDWSKAYDACIEGIIQYPFTGYFTKLEEICEKQNKTFKLHWMERTYYPNMMSVSNQEQATQQPWSFYTGAKERIAEVCNEEGIIKRSTTLTEQKYLEVYSWEYMLKKSDADEKEIGFARTMQEQGYLDCYSMISMFHITFWEQYVHFRENNRERMRTYIETQLVR